MATHPPQADRSREALPGPVPSCSPVPRFRKRGTWFVLAAAAGVAAVLGWWFFGPSDDPLHTYRDALQRHDPAGALAVLEDHLRRHPEDVDHLLAAGRLARRLGRYREAESYLIRCQEAGGITEATLLEWDLFRVQQGDLGSTHMRLRRTIPPDHPDAPRVLEALARGYLACDRLLDALEACDLWVARTPEEPWPRLWRGRIHELLTRTEPALEDFGRAVALAPGDAEMRTALANLLVKERRPAAAAEHFAHLLAASPEDSGALLGLAYCLLEQGRPREAEKHLLVVLERDPHSARALLLRGRAVLETNEPAAAEPWLSQAVAASQHDPEPLHRLILALRAQGKTSEADRLAPRLEQMRRDVDRLDELIRIIARRPNEIPLRHEAGTLALRLGRTDDALRWWNGALRLPGDHRALHASLAEHYAAIGDPRADHHRLSAGTP